MPSADLVIKNATLVTSNLTFRAGIAVTDGVISSVASNEHLPSAQKIVDASGLYVLPGIIDSHVHLRDPGFTYKEDFSTGTMAAAAGGVTCVFDMPNNNPPIKSVEALEEKLEVVRRKAVVDYGFYALLGAGNLHDLAGLSRSGVIGFKCFLTEALQVEPPEDGEVLEDFAEVARLKRRVTVHAENDSIVKYRVRDLKERKRGDANAHLESRPAVAEEEAVNRTITYARESGCKVNIAHLSSERSVEAVRLAIGRRENVTAETCPHYLLLDSARYEELGSLMKVNPAIRTPTDRAALWEGLRDGTIGIITSDHAPQAEEEKRKPMIFDCLSGISGLETMVPLMLTQVNKGLISITEFVKLSSENPARTWEVFPRKGCLNVGSDADLTIIDMKKRVKISAESFMSKAKWSPFDGYEATGVPVFTIVRGKVVMERGSVDHKPKGEMVSPVAQPPE